MSFDKKRPNKKKLMPIVFKMTSPEEDLKIRNAARARGLPVATLARMALLEYVHDAEGH